MSNYTGEATIIVSLCVGIVLITTLIQYITYHTCGKHIGYNSFWKWLNRTFEEENYKRRHRFK